MEKVRHTISFPRCIVCDTADDVRRCPVCGDFVCIDHLSLIETWSSDNAEVDLDCEHTDEYDPILDNSGPGWDDGSVSRPDVPLEGLPRVR